MLKAVKKTLGWSTIFHELRKVLWKRGSLRIILRFLNEELQSNRVQDSIHELIIWKVNPFNFSGGSRGTVAHNCHGKTKNLTAKTKYLTAKPKTSRQKQSYFVFAVRFLVWPWGILFLPCGFWFCREVFCFCREVFGFAVMFLFLPWSFWFCRASCGPPYRGGSRALLLVRPNWAPKGRKKFFLVTAPPAYLRVWMAAPPTPSYLKVCIRHWICRFSNL